MVRRPVGLVCLVSSGAGQVQPMGSKGWFCFLLCLFLSPLAGKVPGRAAQGGAACCPPHQRFFWRLQLLFTQPSLHHFRGHGIEGPSPGPTRPDIKVHITAQPRFIFLGLALAGRDCSDEHPGCRIEW